MIRATIVLGLMLMLASPALAQPPPEPPSAAEAPTPPEPPSPPEPEPADEPLDFATFLMTGGRLPPGKLEAAIAAAADKPLGGKENPVRVNMPAGQQAYLRRLRCSNGRAPTFFRVGNFGPGVFGSIIDGYEVTCPGGGEPAKSLIFMDMYHPGHDETAAPPGFTLQGRARQP